MNFSYRRIFWAFLVIFSAITQNSVDTTPCPATGPTPPDCVDCGTVTAGTPEEMDCICNGEVPGTCAICEDGGTAPCLNCTDQPENPTCADRCEADPTAEGCPPVAETTQTTASSGTTASSSSSSGQNRRRVRISNLSFQVRRRINRNNRSRRG